MAGETTEALRLVCMFTSTILPLAGNAALWTLQCGRKLFGWGTDLIDGSLATVDGYGKVGIIDGKRLRGQVKFEDLTDTYSSREDIRELGDICSALGVGFSVVEDSKGFVGVKYEADNYELMAAAFAALHRRYISKEEMPEFEPTYKAGDSFKLLDMNFTCINEDKYVMPFESVDGKMLNAVIDKEGNWSIRGGTNQVVELSGIKLAGKSPLPEPDITDAMYLASGAASILQSEMILKHYVNEVQNAETPVVTKEKLMAEIKAEGKRVRAKQKDQFNRRQQARMKKAPTRHQ